MKKILKKYKELINELKSDSIKHKYNSIENNSEIYTETENIVKIFPIEVVASTFENRLLAENYDIVKDFWTFITNENVDLSNITRFENIIKQEILEQYPNLKILNYRNDRWFLDDGEVDFVRNWYKEQNGEFIIIKSIKKGYEKVLKLQQK